MKRALLVGIDHYEDFNDLGGCVNDVTAIEALLRRNDDDSPNFDCVTRTTITGGVTRDRLLTDLDALLGGGADVAILYFAGHGDGSGADVALVTEDGTNQTPGIAFSELLTKVATSPVREIIIILDCCFAGAAGGVPQLGTSATALREGVSILAASRGDQTAGEIPGGQGLFSAYLVGALDGGAADVVGKVTIAGLYSYLDESFDGDGVRSCITTPRPVLRYVAPPLQEASSSECWSARPDPDSPDSPGPRCVCAVASVDSHSCEFNSCQRRVHLRASGLESREPTGRSGGCTSPRGRR